MPRRRGSTRGKRAPPRGTPGSGSHTGRGTPGIPGVGRIQKNTRSNHARRQASQSLQPADSNTDTNASSTSSENAEDNTSEYRASPHQNSPHNTPNVSISTPSTLSETSFTLSAEDILQHPQSQPEPTLRLNDIRELLQSHEQGIVDRVVNQLNSQNATNTRPYPQTNTCEPPTTSTVPASRPRNSTILRITELEGELAQLRAEQEMDQAVAEEPRTPGTYNPTYPFIEEARESAPGIPESVELLFPGVERTTLVQIIENRFKPTNIYRLLATEKERAESQRTINIGGIEFEQAERDGKESEYKMSGFFKAWAAYSGILVKLAPHALQGELATALFIYTMNLYDLLEKYTWDGVKAYHFQFHRKRVAAGKSIYYPSEWRQIDSELIASRCFAHPHIPRPSWTSSQNRPATFPRRNQELPIRERPTTPAFPYSNPAHSNRVTQIATQVCRNWNYRECRSAYCRNQHICITCGSNHKAPQCTQGNTALSHPARSGPYTR